MYIDCMDADKWDKVIKFLNSKPKATPEKVLNMLKTTYGKRNTPESSYEVVRASWPWIVVGAIANKIGTKDKNKKIPTTLIIRNWIKTKEFKNDWCWFHPKKVKNKELNITEWNMASEEDREAVGTARHVKRIQDILNSKIGKHIRSQLTPSGKFPIDNKTFQNHIKKLS